MARIPTQNRYPDRAGYTVLNTDTNQLEVFSDGTYIPVGPELLQGVGPELLQGVGYEPNGVNYENESDLNPIIITVGPGKDFEYLDEAVWHVYKQNLYDSSFSSVNNSQTLSLKQFKIVISNDFIFDKCYVFQNMFLPNLEITQEDYNIPLLVNGYAAIHLKNNTTINKIKLNLEGSTNTPLRDSGIKLWYNSHINRLQLKAKKMLYGVTLEYNSKIDLIYIDNANQLQRSALFLMYNCFALLIIAHISDVGITYPYSAANGIWVNQSDLRIYYGQNVTIDNVVSGFRIMEQGRIVISGGNLNISNATNGIQFAFNGGSLIAKPATITYTNVTNEINPTTIIPNEWNPNGIVII